MDISNRPGSTEVSADTLEHLLSEVAAGCREEEGLFGPASATWRVGREFVNFMGAGRAALLQLAHPWVATAVAHHSVTSRDIAGRFHRTFEQLYGMMFGPLSECLAAARRVHGVHIGVRGRLEVPAGGEPAGADYAANVEEALLWVHATLVDTSFAIHSRCVGPRSDAELEAHYQESRRFARLFGLSDEVLPEDHAAFRRYWAEMLASGRLEVTPHARALAPQLMRPRGGIYAPGWAVYGVVTRHLLPESIREGYGLSLSPAERAAAEVILSVTKRALPAMPPRLRYVAAYHDAMRRLAGGRGRDRVSAAVWDRLVGTLLGPRAAAR